MPTSAAPHTPLGRLGHWARIPLVHAFRVTPESRDALVQQMLTRQVQDAPMYWLQLVLAMAIATLGLALGSTVVVIGAMLISPLMTPIVELGMGLASGLPALVARSVVRVAVSVVVVVGAAALITLALPFHEVTAPIAARAAPTLLDLLIAVCCALMASFATVTARSGTTTTAAGTALAIALVPPLCVVGFGLGTGQLAIAQGAALLFTANFSAIMLFAVLTFTAFGFGEAYPRRRWALGAILRIVMPLLLLGLIYLPLRQALQEVSWEVRTRQAIRSELGTLSADTVRSEVEVAQRRVRVQLVVIGDTLKAETLRRHLELRIAAAAGVVPSVSVLAVPDAERMRATIRAAQPPTTPVIREPRLDTTTARIASVLGRLWPTDAAGQLVTWRLDVGSDGTALLEAVHFGGELGAAAEQVLGRELSDAAGGSVRVSDVVLPHEPLSAPAAEGAWWMTQLSPLLVEVSRFDVLHACLGVPPASTVSLDGGTMLDGGQQAGVDTLRSAVFAAAARVPGARARVTSDASWSLRVEVDPCPELDAAPDAGELSDGGATDAAHE